MACEYLITCAVCGKDFVALGSRAKYCPDCRDEVHRAQARKWCASKKGDLEFAEKRREYMREWRKNNPEKVSKYNRETQKKYREIFPEYYREYQREYYHKNLEKLREYQREYQREYRQKKKLEAKLNGVSG